MHYVIISLIIQVDFVFNVKYRYSKYAFQLNSILVIIVSFKVYM